MRSGGRAGPAGLQSAGRSGEDGERHSLFRHRLSLCSGHASHFEQGRPASTGTGLPHHIQYARPALQSGGDPARAGDFVEKDTLLAKIDDEPFRQQMLQAKAAYSAAQSTFERLEKLYKAGSTTQQNYDSAKAQADASKAQYDLAKLQLNYTEVRAPVAGTILIADQAVGDIANQSQPAAVLADLSNQVVRLKVPEKYFDLFTLERENLSVKVTRPAEKAMYEDAVTTATIENIAPYVSPESKNFIVVCRLDEQAERFRPGMFVKVQVAYKTYENVPLISLKARKLDGSFYIFDEATHTVKFIEGESFPDDGENFIVPEKYRNSYVVMDGQNFVFDGQKVRLFDEALKEANEGL